MATKTATSSTKKSNNSTKSKQTVVEATARASNSKPVSLKSIGSSIKKTPLVGKLVAEFVGTFLLTAAFLEMQSSPLFVAFALTGVVLIIGGVSGAHVNPAITIGAWVTKKMNWVSALGYIVAQLIGGGTAYLVLNAFAQATATSDTIGSSLMSAATIVTDKEWYLFFAELLGSTILALGVATAIRIRKNKVASAFTAGMAILIALYVSMSLSTVLLTASGTALTFLNPALAFAAQGFSWKLWPILVFIVAPAIGGIVGFALQDFLHFAADDDCDCCGC